MFIQYTTTVHENTAQNNSLKEMEGAYVNQSHLAVLGVVFCTSQGCLTTSIYFSKLSALLKDMINKLILVSERCLMDIIK